MPESTSHCPHYQVPTVEMLKGHPLLPIIEDVRGDIKICTAGSRAPGLISFPQAGLISAHCEGDFAGCDIYRKAGAIDKDILAKYAHNKNMMSRLIGCCHNVIGREPHSDMDLMTFFDVCKERYSSGCYLRSGRKNVRKFGKGSALLLQRYLLEKRLIQEPYFTKQG